MANPQNDKKIPDQVKISLKEELEGLLYSNRSVLTRVVHTTRSGSQYVDPKDRFPQDELRSTLERLVVAEKEKAEAKAN